VPHVVVGKTEMVLDRVDDFLAAGMDDPVVDVARPQAVPAEQATNGPFDMLADDVGNVAIQVKRELRAFQVVPHGVDGVGDDVGLEIDQQRTDFPAATV
jgi:hypothetical protein